MRVGLLMKCDSSVYTGQYVEYKSVHDYKRIWEFMEYSSIYSNCSSNLYEKVKKLIEYEKKRKLDISSRRKKVFAIEMLVMLPKDLPKHERHQVIKEYMLQISPIYKRVIYIYTFEKIGRGSYCRIFAFQRMYYNKTHEVAIKYKRDMWINKETGRTCSSNDDNAIKICSKGDFKKDSNGNKLYEKIDISPKKYRCLNFKDDNDMEKKVKKFNSFKNRLLKKIVFALSKTICFQNIYMKLRHRKFIKNENELSKRVLYYNSVINEVNIKLQLMQNTFYYRGLIWDKEESWKKFEHVFFNINQILKNGFVYLNKTNVKIFIDPEFKMTFQQFKENIQIFKRIIDNKIKDWYIDQFYDPIYDSNSK